MADTSCEAIQVSLLFVRLALEEDEEVEVNEYTRLTPFEVDPASLKNDLTKIKKGDCVVSFSRNEIFSYKEKIEKLTGLRCAVAYGGLPPGKREIIMW